MQPERRSYSHNGHTAVDRATGVLLASGGVSGVSAFVLRHWQPGTDPPEPVFVTWLLDVGRFCLTVRYGRFSLRGGEWYIDGGSGPGITPSPLEQARVEALLMREMLKRPLPVAPALALFDMDPDRMDPDRRIDGLARRSRVPLLWDLEGYTGRLADAAARAGLRQPLERRAVLAEISALIEGAAPVGAGPSRQRRLAFGPHRSRRGCVAGVVRMKVGGPVKGRGLAPPGCRRLSISPRDNQKQCITKE